MGQEYGILTDPGSNPDDQQHCMAPTVDGAVQASMDRRAELSGEVSVQGATGGDLLGVPNVPYERA